MAATLLALLDVATRHTVKIAGVGAKGAMASMTVTIDDMAVTAGKPSSEGIPQHLEHRFVLDSAKLSSKNKLWQYPLLLALIALFPATLVPLLSLGALYLCYEGWEETHALVHHHLHHKKAAAKPVVDTEGYVVDEPIVLDEPITNDRLREIIREAGVLDVILSAEIGIIALKAMGAAADFATAAKDFHATGNLQAYAEPLYTHGPALMLVAVIATLGVYLPVWVLLRADNWAEHLTNLQGKSLRIRTAQAIGHYLVPVTHFVMRALPYLGTAAMLAVGGHIMLHNSHTVADAITAAAEQAGGFGLVVEYGSAIAAGLVFGVIIEKLGLPLFRPIWKSVKSLYKQLVKPKSAA